MSRMMRGVQFRKYRPNVSSYRGHYKEWWEFAYKCVLEHEVRRKRRNWDWDHIKTHRKLCKEYGRLYQMKVHSKRAVVGVEGRLKELERQLDAFNIILIRQRAELEVARLGKDQEASRSSSWFGSWWSSKPVEEVKELSIGEEVLKGVAKEEKIPSICCSTNFERGNCCYSAVFSLSTAS